MPAPKDALKESLDHIQYLEKQDSRRSEFFLAASHQLKAPVAIIQWCLQSVVEQEQALPSDLRELVHKSILQADAMSHLITDMLHIFRLSARDRKKVNFAPVDVLVLIDQIMAQYEVMAHKQGVHLKKGAMQNVKPVLAEEAYLRQAILNLIDNAIKYSHRDGMVTISTKAAADGFVEIHVHDEGIGIAEAEKSKLFTEFFRGQEAQELVHDGTGLGLVLVKHVVEELGGEVLVESELHKGSSFIMRLPQGSV